MLGGNETLTSELSKLRKMREVKAAGLGGIGLGHRIELRISPCVAVGSGSRLVAMPHVVDAS